MWPIFLSLYMLLFGGYSQISDGQLCAFRASEQLDISGGLPRVYARQISCNSLRCPAGHVSCPSFPNYCCPAGIICKPGSSGVVVCNINCTSADITCSFGGCCPPGSICDPVNLSCQSINTTIAGTSTLIRKKALTF